MFPAFLVVGALAAAAPVLAQPVRGLPQATPQQIAAARAEGDALLKAAHAEDLFDNETDSPAIVLRHKASGFRCVFNPGKPQNRVIVAKSLTRGDDVGCWTETVTDARELYFSRVPEMTPAQMLAQDVKVIQNTDPGAKVYTPAPTRSVLGMPPGVTVPEPVTASLKGGRGGHRVVVGKIGDWMVDYRFQGGPEVGDLSAILDSFWVTTVLEQRRHLAMAKPSPLASAPVQPSPSAPRPPNPGDRAAARAEADAIIQRASAADVFENVTTDILPSLRHKPSGFVCTLYL